MSPPSLMFRFVPRENWLPFDTEGMWATPVTAASILQS